MEVAPHAPPGADRTEHYDLRPTRLEPQGWYMVTPRRVFWFSGKLPCKRGDCPA